MDSREIEQLVEAARQAICARDEDLAIRALHDLGPHYAQVAPTAAVDLLERICALGTRAMLTTAYEAIPEFVYEGWALALALRCANEPTARFMLERGCDLLGSVHQPTTYRALLPHEGTFTRFDLTRQSPTLFVNPMDPTVGTEVFEPFRGRANEHLAGSAYEATVDLQATCALVAKVAEEGCFDPVVFDDLFRAAMVRAWHALRHEGEHDEQTAQTCLDLGARMLGMRHLRSQDATFCERILASLIVPKAHPRIVAFICDHAPQVFLERLSALSWLQKDVGLVSSMVPHLSPGEAAHNGMLLRIMAAHNRMAELELMSRWPDTFGADQVSAAMEAASREGHAEAATWLLARMPRQVTASSAEAGTGADLLDDLLL